MNENDLLNGFEILQRKVFLCYYTTQCMLKVKGNEIPIKARLHIHKNILIKDIRI